MSLKVNEIKYFSSVLTSESSTCHPCCEQLSEQSTEPAHHAKRLRNQKECRLIVPSGGSTVGEVGSFPNSKLPNNTPPMSSDREIAISPSPHTRNQASAARFSYPGCDVRGICNRPQTFHQHEQNLTIWSLVIPNFLVSDWLRLFTCERKERK